jgi:branched-chain amino acid aminotransferase
MVAPSVDPFIVRNNSIISSQEARIFPSFAGLLAGWGVFTTLRLYRGTPFEFGRHWARLTRDAARVRLNLTFQESYAWEKVCELARANGRAEGMARLYLVKSDAAREAPPGTPNFPTELLAFTRPLPNWPPSYRLRLQPHAVYSQSPFAGTKMMAWAPYLVWQEAAREESLDALLLLNEKGHLVECTSANVFLVCHSRLLTPSLASGCLSGVTREVLLEIAAQLKIPACECDLTPDDLSRAEEVFISSTTREVGPVESITPHWSYPAPGPVTRALAQAFQNHVRLASNRAG